MDSFAKCFLNPLQNSNVQQSAQCHQCEPRTVLQIEEGIKIRGATNRANKLEENF